MKLHEAVARALLHQGVDTVFGLIGDGNLYMMNSFRELGGRYLAVANESAAMLAAAGYHSVTGKLGVGTVTHGPGLSNTVTSLIELAKSGSPSVLIAADTPTTDPENFQDIPQRALVEACGAGFVQARSPELIVHDLRSAIRRAVVEGRPVVLNIPIEFQWVDIEYEEQPIVPLLPDAVLPDPERVEEAVGIIAASRRPLILAGRGAIAGRDAVLRLAERIAAPVATTVQARQLFAGEPANIGIFGGLASEVATEVILEADLVIAFGASLNKWTTAEGSLLEGKSVIQVDSRPAALGAKAVPTVGVVGDSGAVADALVALLDEAEIGASPFGGAGMADRLARAAVSREDSRLRRRGEQALREERGDREAATVDLRLAMTSLETEFPTPRTLVTDAGRQVYTALEVLTVATPTDYVHSIHFGAIGLGLPYALGAALGTPGQPTLLVAGDGGFMLGGLTEFSTAVREKLDLVVVLMNDGAFGAEHIQLHNKQLDTTISTFDWPDLGPVADSLGGRGFTVRTIAELDDALAAIPSRDRPILIDVKLSADEISVGG